jgi:acetyl-CoA carboxylase biotin carboxylase subunit
LLKASAGGGGRGMRIVRGDEDLAAAFQGAQAEAQAAFGDNTVYLEKFIEQARHIEIQVLGDLHGNLVHLYERDCSTQRRHQKLIEESPSPVLSDARRHEMAEAAVALARQVKYHSAGTIEFVFDAAGDRFYFLEMNTRIQVEHPVTEAVTGVDLVQEQIRVAAGMELSYAQGDIRPRGHSIECRINAEDPVAGFRPSPGTLQHWSIPGGAGIRVDTHCYEGYAVPVHYDSLLAKVITHGDNRERATELMCQALAGARIDGVHTTVPLHQAVLSHDDFRAGRVTTRWLENDFLPAW